MLREDNLKFYVLQYYEDFIKLALERGELHAAATLYQEAAAFAARAGLPYDRHYQHKSALTWMRCADKFVETGVPVQMTENALLAAASQHSAVGDYPAVRECFERLAGLELPDRAKKRFATIAQRYKGLAAPPVELPGLPDYLKQQHAYADIWFVDLLEWEMDGDPFAVAASIVGDLRYPNGIRRRALVVLLTLADAQARKRGRRDRDARRTSPSCSASCSRTPRCRRSRSCSRAADPVIRRAAVRALRFLYFKRSFVIVRKALADPDAQVREAALVAIGGLHFPHAFNPLARIYRESNDPRVRDRGAAVDRQDPDGRGRRVPRHGAAPGDRQPARGRARRRSRRWTTPTCCRSSASTTRSRRTRRSARRSASCCAGTEPGAGEAGRTQVVTRGRRPRRVAPPATPRAHARWDLALRVHRGWSCPTSRPSSCRP